MEYSELIPYCRGNGEDQETLLDFLYRQRNNPSLFKRRGKYGQTGADEVTFTQQDVNAMWQQGIMEEEEEYANQVDEEFVPSINHEVYQYDSDDGESSFHPDIYNKDTVNRRKTLPSEKKLIPTMNSWE